MIPTLEYLFWFFVFVRGKSYPPNSLLMVQRMWLYYLVIYFLCFQAYKWEDDKAAVEWLLKQKEDGAENNSIDDDIRCLHREHVLQQVRRLVYRLKLEALVIG